MSTDQILGIYYLGIRPGEVKDCQDDADEDAALQVGGHDDKEGRPQQDELHAGHLPPAQPLTWRMHAMLSVQGFGVLQIAFHGDEENGLTQPKCPCKL